MSADQSALLVAFVAFLGVVSAPIVTGFLSQQQARRKERHEYITNVVTALIDLRAELTYAQQGIWRRTPDAHLMDALSPEQSDDYERGMIKFGKAYAIMISVDIPEIRDKAKDIVTPRMTGRPLTDPDVKLAAIDFAIERLGKEYGFWGKPKTEDWRNP